MESQGRMRELVLEFTKDPDWLPSVTTDITDAIHLGETASRQGARHFRDARL